jgi:FkbM family methyltransferase
MKLMPPLVWKLHQLWLKAQCHLRFRKYMPYQLCPGVKFVAHLDDINSHDIYIKKSYESTELEWCAKWLSDGDSLIDCGANIGYYSACLSQLHNLKKVLAIEGNETCATRCQVAFTELKLQKVELIRAILHSDESRSLHIPDLPGQEGLQHLEEAPDGVAKVKTTTLDNLASERNINPSLIKIDCEGAETEILRGAKELLSKTRPAWLIEVNDDALKKAGTHREELFLVLTEANYKLFHIASAFAKQPFGVEVGVNFQSWSFNLAAIPDDERNLHRWKSTFQK